jgi:hypothetical protein
MSNQVTLASVLKSGFSQHSKNSTSLTSAYYRVVDDILRCRTSDAGSRSEQCDHCGQKHVLTTSEETDTSSVPKRIKIANNWEPVGKCSSPCPERTVHLQPGILMPGEM